MGHGGRRSGAGRKPGSKRRPVVLGMDGLRKPAKASRFVLPELPAVPAEDLVGLCEPPSDLGAAEQAVWRQLAPHALLERTLTPSRVSGFSQLCQEWVYCAALDVRIQQLGVTSNEADRVLRRLTDWKKLLKSSLADFNLKSFGKPVAVEKPKPAANPWTALGSAATPK